MTETAASKTPSQLAKCVRTLDDKKARDLQIIRVADVSSITDYVVLATATSEPHLRALSNELAKCLKEERTAMVGIDYATESGWLVVDAFDFMVHVFLAPVREAYRLEGLWRGCPKIDAAQLLAPAPKPAKKRASAKKTAPKGAKAKKPAAAKAKASSRKANPAKRAPRKSAKIAGTRARKAPRRR